MNPGPVEERFMESVRIRMAFLQRRRSSQRVSSATSFNHQRSTTMFPAFLLTKLFRTKNVAVYPTTNPAIFLHTGCLFLRRISSNTSCAVELSGPVNTSAEFSASSLEKPSLNRRKEKNRDYTVSYLVESCGLSPKEALSAAEKVHFATREKPDSVLDLLRNHGFSSTQITTVVRKRPRMLLTNAEKIIMPKLGFLLSMGLSRNDLAQIVCVNSSLLEASLANQIEPVCNLLKSFLKSDKRFCAAIKRSWLLTSDRERVLVPNLALLEKLQMPASCISLFLSHCPQVLVQNHEAFCAGVSKAKEMGFNPLKSTFVQAVECLTGKSKKRIWDRSYKIYTTKWGWSEEDILSAFSKHPHCMIMSEKRLNLAMEFLVNTMGWCSKCIAQQPVVLLYSLERRIIPRCSVIRVLQTKGLLRKDLSPVAVLKPVEKIFLERYVTRYEQKLPQLVRVYNGEMDPLKLMVKIEVDSPKLD